MGETRTMAAKRTYGLRSLIRPGMALEEIRIKLNPYGPPVVELVGKVSTGNRMVDMASGMTITTQYLDDEGKAFVERCKALFDKRGEENPH